jgi:hypothetical protein
MNGLAGTWRPLATLAVTYAILAGFLLWATGFDPWAWYAAAVPTAIFGLAFVLPAVVAGAAQSRGFLEGLAEGGVVVRDLWQSLGYFGARTCRFATQFGAATLKPTSRRHLDLRLATGYRSSSFIPAMGGRWTDLGRAEGQNLVRAHAQQPRRGVGR